MEDGNRKGFEDAVQNANLPEFDFDTVNQRLKEASKANIQHIPRQQGPEIICVSCPHPHSMAWIGTQRKMVGIDEKGQPIIEPM
jgi:hypothetical protein